MLIDMPTAGKDEMKQLSRGHAKPTKQSPSRQVRSFDVPWHWDVHESRIIQVSGQKIGNDVVKEETSLLKCCSHRKLFVISVSQSFRSILGCQGA